MWNYFDLSQGCLCGRGTWNLYGALAHSCNTYFSNVGLNLGIARLAPYAEYFGLGTTTGVEIGESTGTMSNPQEYRENHGVNWTDGVSAQTAIGQADNMFTPIQLATMCATIANGGVRLQTHFLDKVLDYTGETVLEAYEPVELYDAGPFQRCAGRGAGRHADGGPPRARPPMSLPITRCPSPPRPAPRKPPT